MYIFDETSNSTVREKYYSHARNITAKIELLDPENAVVKTIDSTDSQPEEIISIDISRGIQSEYDFLGCTISKEYDICILDVDKHLQFEGVYVRPYIGVATEEGIIYTPFPRGVVYEAVYDTVKKTWNIVCYDEMQRFNNLILRDCVIKNGDASSGQEMTLRQYVEAVCDNVGISFSSSEFFNENMLLTPNDFSGENGQNTSSSYRPNLSGEETLREVISKAAQAALCNAVINRMGELEFIPVYSKFKTERDLHITAEDYFSFETDEVFGPVNTVVLARENSEDNIYYPPQEERDTVYMDEEKTVSVQNHIEQYGIKELKIYDNPFYDRSVEDAETDTRTGCIADIFEQMKGMKYTAYNMAFRGDPSVDEGDRIIITGVKGEDVETTYFSDTLSYDGALKAVSEGKIINQTATEYDNAVSIRRTLRNTQIKVDKNEGMISSLTKEVEEAKDDISQNYSTIEHVNELVQTAVQGITNKFSKTGGFNLLRNTAPYFGEDESWDYWEGDLGRTKEPDSVSGYAMLLKKGTVSQTAAVSKNRYSLAFKYKVLNEGASKGSVTVNGQTVNLLESHENNEVHMELSVDIGSITIEMASDLDDAFEIYDLMLNVGEVAMEWTQNANETISDTVNISSGIEVISNTTNTKTRMDSDGFRVLNEAGEAILRATCEDGEANVQTAYLTSVNGARISGLSIQKVESEVWISGIH